MCAIFSLLPFSITDTNRFFYFFEGCLTNIFVMIKGYPQALIQMAPYLFRIIGIIFSSETVNLFLFGKHPGGRLQ